MYMRIATVNVGGNRRNDAEALADKMTLAMKNVAGFKGISYFANDEAGLYGTVSHFETKESMEEATEVLRSLSLDTWGPEILQATASVNTYDEYIPQQNG